MTEGAGARASLRVGIVGCGAVGTKRARRPRPRRARRLLRRRIHGRRTLCRDGSAGAHAPRSTSCSRLEPDVVVVAVTHDALADNACRALRCGRARPRGEAGRDRRAQTSTAIAETAEAGGRLVKVGFNHRFHPAISQRVAEAALGPVRADHCTCAAATATAGASATSASGAPTAPAPAAASWSIRGCTCSTSATALLGPLPLHCALLRTAFWPMDVEDNAVADPRRTRVAGPWAMLHASWTEWKNLFSLEVYCATGEAAGRRARRLLRRAAAASSSRCGPSWGRRTSRSSTFPSDDTSWAREWAAFTEAIVAGDDRPLGGDLQSARYGWSCIEDAYARAERGAVRA